MKRNQHFYKYFWEFAYERQNIFFKRFNNEPFPWSDNPIFNTYKFTNVYRVSDRVSQYLVKNVIYNKKWSIRDVIFRILFFKIFNRIDTWETLEKEFGELTFDKFDFKTFDDFMSSLKVTIFSNAYMMCTNRKSPLPRKHSNYLKLLEQMFEEKIDERIVNSKSLAEVFKILNSYMMIGGFLAYQFAIDINYSEAINFSENSFVEAGGGSKRGIMKCFKDAEENKNWEEIIMWMVENQEQEFARYGYDFKNLFGRPMQAIDVQNVFCETDKYTREAVKTSAIEKMKRIKTRFKNDEKKPKIEFFFPPKWNLKF